MMRSAGIHLFLISALTTGVVAGQTGKEPQNTDIGVLAGPVLNTTLAIAGANGPVKISGVFDLQANFAYTLHSYSFADLWLEMPITFAFHGSGDSGNVRIPSYRVVFATPGVRLSVPVRSRVSFYGVAGGGVANIKYSQQSVIPGGPTDNQGSYPYVVDFGGGMDFRLTRLWSVRGELRDFVTGRSLGGVSGRNQLVFGFGVAAHL